MVSARSDKPKSLAQQTDQGENRHTKQTLLSDGSIEPSYRSGLPLGRCMNLAPQDGQQEKSF